MILVYTKQEKLPVVEKKTTVRVVENDNRQENDNISFMFSFQVIDNNKERNIGIVEISLSSLVDEEDMSCEKPFPLKDSGPESALVCELKLRVLN